MKHLTAPDFQCSNWFSNYSKIPDKLFGNRHACKRLFSMRSSSKPQIVVGFMPAAFNFEPGGIENRRLQAFRFPEGLHGISYLFENKSEHIENRALAAAIKL